MQTIFIVGAGTMGSGIAQVAAQSGFSVRLYDISTQQLERARVTISANLDRLVKKEKLTAADKDATLARIATATQLDGVASADLVIEAASENEALKLELFAKLDALAKPEAILASNTSSISITKIAAATKNPARVIGMHFFNPVPVMALVEIIRGLQTSDATHEAVQDLARRLGKSPITVKNAPGFVVNRLLAKVMGEAARAVYEGTPVADVEKAFAPLGLPMGPFQLIDLVGWKVAAHVQDTMVRAFPERFYANENFHALAELAEVVEKDKGGRVTGFTKDAHKVLKGHVASTPASAGHRAGTNGPASSQGGPWPGR